MISEEVAAVENLIKSLEIKASVMEMGERIAWGSDTALMREAAHYLKRLSAAKQNEARYEKLRTLNAREFAELYELNISGKGRFDDLVDELINL